MMNDPVGIHKAFILAKSGITNGTPGKTPPIISCEGEPFCLTAHTACDRILLRARSELASRESVEGCDAGLR